MLDLFVLVVVYSNNMFCSSIIYQIKYIDTVRRGFPVLQNTKNIQRWGLSVAIYSLFGSET